MELKKLSKIIENITGIKPDEIEKNSHLVDDLGFDDIDIIEIFMDIEEEFGFEIEDNKWNELKTIEDILLYIDEKIS